MFGIMTSAGEFEHLLLRDGGDVVIITLEPLRSPLAPRRPSPAHPRHVVPAGRGAPPVREHGLQAVEAAVAAAHV